MSKREYQAKLDRTKDYGEMFPIKNRCQFHQNYKIFDMDGNYVCEDDGTVLPPPTAAKPPKPAQEDVPTLELGPDKPGLEIPTELPEEKQEEIGKKYVSQMNKTELRAYCDENAVPYGPNDTADQIRNTIREYMPENKVGAPRKAKRGTKKRVNK